MAPRNRALIMMYRLRVNSREDIRCRDFLAVVRYPTRRKIDGRAMRP